MLLGPSLIGSAVRNFARITCGWVDDHDPTHALVDPLAIEGDLRPIGRPCRQFVEPALGRVCDLADMAPVWVHREERSLGMIGIEPAAKDDLTVGGSTTTALALVVLSSSATLSRALASTGAQQEE